jgi:hypothetical protein
MQNAERRAEIWGNTFSGSAEVIAASRSNSLCILAWCPSVAEATVQGQCNSSFCILHSSFCIYSPITDTGAHMDYLILAGVVVAGWAMLAVLSGERMNRAQRMAVVAAEQARVASAVPIATSNDAALAGSPAAFNQKR